MTGSKKSFEKWVEGRGGRADTSFTWRDGPNQYEVQAPDLDLYWYGHAENATQARILAVQYFEKAVKQNSHLPSEKKERFDRQRGKRHLSHDFYVSQLFKAQKNKDTGLRKSLNYDLQRMSKFHRDEIMRDFRATYKKWYDSQSGMRRATTKNPRPPKSIRDVGAGPDKAQAQKWYGFGWNAARGGALSTPPDNAYRGMYLKGYREYRPGQAPLLENPGGRFTAAHLAKLRKGYAGISSVDPELPTYAALTAMLDTMTQAQLKQLAKARINFVSGLALNRIKRKGNPGMARKKPRTAKQRAATRKLLAFNKARRKKKKKTARRKTRRNPQKARKIAKFSGARRLAKRKTGARTNLWLIFKVSNRGVLYLSNPTAGQSMFRPSKTNAVLMQSKASAKAIATAAAKKMTTKGSQIGVTKYSTPESVIRRAFTGK